MQYGKISPDDLRLLLGFYPLLDQELEEARELLLEKSEKIPLSSCNPAAWCQHYERPVNEHLAHIFGSFGALDVLKSIAGSTNQIQTMVDSTNQFVEALENDDTELNADEAESVRRALPAIFGLSLSANNTFRCLLIFGVYLNDLIALVRQGGKLGDRALFQAVKIDITVMGCPSVLERVSRASMEGDLKFFGKLRRAMTGKLTKREDRTYQRMRLVLQVLLESAAPRLSEGDLYQLFAEELNIVARERDGDTGNVANNLRQFAYQFMKQKSVSQNS